MVKVPFYKPMFTWRTQGSQFLLYKTLEAPKNISQHHSYEAPMWTIPFLLFSTWRMPWLHRTSKPTRGLFVPNHLKTWIIFSPVGCEHQKIFETTTWQRGFEPQRSARNFPIPFPTSILPPERQDFLVNLGKTLEQTIFGCWKRSFPQGKAAPKSGRTLFEFWCIYVHNILIDPNQLLVCSDAKTCWWVIYTLYMSSAIFLPSGRKLHRWNFRRIYMEKGTLERCLIYLTCCWEALAHPSKDPYQIAQCTWEGGLVKVEAQRKGPTLPAINRVEKPTQKAI